MRLFSKFVNKPEHRLTRSDKRYLEAFIGVPVHKVSGKPFKSGEKVNTIKGVIKHPHVNRYAFLFVEDDSYVECFRCEKESDFDLIQHW